VHQPVMLQEAISSLNLKPGLKVLDATIGGGGHSIPILERIQPGGLLIGLDADASAVTIAQDALKNFGASCILAHSNFRDLDKVLSQNNIGKLDAALFDIGVSSFQLDDASRGFSLQQEGSLDMRMDRDIATTAADIVNRLKEQELSEIIQKFGEERFSRRIAHSIVQARSEKPIETTAELKEIIHRSVGRFYRKQRIDAATRTFQAIRIVVNDELGALEEGVTKAIASLNPGGRICVISFHSLEDRIVKNIFRQQAAAGAVRIITKKPLRPSDAETVTNPRSRSAKLRVAEKS
jgi:16S rRNA (cytosine1402-N4)-methyltransferase